VGQPQGDALRRVGRDPPHRDPLDRFDPARHRTAKLPSAVEIRERSSFPIVFSGIVIAGYVGEDDGAVA
jgi:hypothetical protein